MTIGARARSILAWETTYGQAPSDGYLQVPIVSSRVRRDQPLLASDVIGLGRDAREPVLSRRMITGELRVPLDVESIGIWLRGLLGNPVTTGTSPKTHTYTSGNYSIPSMTLELGLPPTRYLRYTGLRVGSLEIEANPGGLVGATVNFAGQDEAGAASSIDDTVTLRSGTRFGVFQAAVKRATVTLGNITRFRMMADNHIDPLEVIRSNAAVTDVPVADFTCEGTIAARFTDTVLLDQAVSGGTAAFEISWTIDANNKLTLSWPNVKLEGGSPVVEGPAGVQAELSWRAFATATEPLMTAELVNSVASY